MGISKNQVKLLTSLSQKKYRLKHKLFIAEGVKVVSELLKSSFEVETLFCTNDFNKDISDEKVVRISEEDLKKISNLKTPNKVLGLFRIPHKKLSENKGLIIALDAINDPGNLGTIIRTADWFGIKNIVLSEGSVDPYGPKVVRSTMGSIFRTTIVEVPNVVTFLKNRPKEYKLCGLDMGGTSITKATFTEQAVYLFGSESHGIRPELESMLDISYSIPGSGDAESLNVAMAAGILMSHL